MRELTLICLALVTALPGCGTQRAKELQAKFEARNNQLIGKSYDDLVRARGVPTREAKLSDGSRIVEYLNSETNVSGGGSYTVPSTTYIPNQNGVGGIWVYGQMERSFPVGSRTYFCKLDFTVSARDVVQGWTAEGNHCY